MAKLRDDRYLYPAGLNSDAVTCLDVIMFKQLSNGSCLTILFKLTLALLRPDSSEALRRRYVLCQVNVVYLVAIFVINVYFFIDSGSMHCY